MARESLHQLFSGTEKTADYNREWLEFIYYVLDDIPMK
jgi:hypothetical protein